MRPHVFAVRAFATIGLLMVSLGAACQSEDKENKVTLDLQMMTRGGIRCGGLSGSEDDEDVVVTMSAEDLGVTADTGTEETAYQEEYYEEEASYSDHEHKASVW